MSDHEISAVKIGPFIKGSVTEKRPATREERRTRLLLWWVTIIVVGSASVPVALVLGTLTVLYLLFRSPAQTDSTTERSPR
jgi:hypothetical protein